MEHDRRHDQNSGNSLHTFLLGVLIGVAITLLFTTKKGRRILKTLTDEGMDKISKWEDILYKAQTQPVEDADEMMDGEDYVATTPKVLPQEKAPETITVKGGASNEPPTDANAMLDKKEAVPEAPKTHSSVRRFFKKAKK